MQVFFTKHALDKFEGLARHGVVIYQPQVEEVLDASDMINDSPSSQKQSFALLGNPLK